VKHDRSPVVELEWPAPRPDSNGLIFNVDQINGNARPVETALLRGAGLIDFPVRDTVAVDQSRCDEALSFVVIIRIAQRRELLALSRSSVSFAGRLTGRRTI
jgi:hypothetical protein